jgi:Beta-lactamase
VGLIEPWSSPAHRTGGRPDRGDLTKLSGKMRWCPRAGYAVASAWQLVRNGDVTIVDKNGGLNNTSTYIGMIPQKPLGIVILVNRDKQRTTRIGRQIMLNLAGNNGPATEEGNEGD